LTVPVPVPTLATVSCADTPKLALLVPVPRGVVTLNGPVVAPTGTVAWITPPPGSSEITVKLALTPLNVTAVAPVKSRPLICTPLPTGAFVGEKLPMIGGPTTLKVLGPAPTPPGVVTVKVTDPRLASAGTVAWISVSESTVKLALAGPKVTEVVPVNCVPLMVTLVPTGPVAGVKLVIVGAPSTVNGLLLFAVPAGVVTLKNPLRAAAGTVAWMVVSEMTVKLALAKLGHDTLVAPVKFVPLIVTVAPTGPLAGLKLVMVGGSLTVNAVALVAVPAELVTLIGPVVAPGGTVVWMRR